MHAVSKRDVSDQMFSDKKNKILNQKWQKKCVLIQLCVGFPMNSKRTHCGQSNISFVTGVGKVNSIMGQS